MARSKEKQEHLDYIKDRTQMNREHFKKLKRFDEWEAAYSSDKQ